MPSIRKPTDGFGAPWYCSTSPTPRSWKKRGLEVPDAQLRAGTRASTSSKCCTPAAFSVPASSTVTLCGSSDIGMARSVAVTTTSSRVSALVVSAARPERGDTSRWRAASSAAVRDGTCIYLLPTPVLTGSGSTGLPVHRHLRSSKQDHPKVYASNYRSAGPPLQACCDVPTAPDECQVQSPPPP